MQIPFGDHKNKLMEGLLKLMKERHSSRGNFDPDRPVSKENIRKILEAGSWAPTAHNMQNFEVIIVDDKKLIQTIAGMKAPVSLKFIRENYKQLSFSDEELRKKKTGISGIMFPPAWRKHYIRNGRGRRKRQGYIYAGRTPVNTGAGDRII